MNLVNTLAQIGNKQKLVGLGILILGLAGIIFLAQLNKNAPPKETPEVLSEKITQAPTLPPPTPMPTPTATPTPQPPVKTRVERVVETVVVTATPVPPTNTPIPIPTDTPMPQPTNTPLPPTNTPAPKPTNTPIPTTLPTPTTITYDEIDGLATIRLGGGVWQNWDADAETDGPTIDIVYLDSQGGIITSDATEVMSISADVKAYAGSSPLAPKDRLVFSAHFSENQIIFGSIYPEIRIPKEQINVNPANDYWCGAVEVIVHTPKQGDFSDRDDYFKLYEYD